MFVSTLANKTAVIRLVKGLIVFFKFWVSNKSAVLGEGELGLIALATSIVFSWILSKSKFFSFENVEPMKKMCLFLKLEKKNLVPLWKLPHYVCIDYILQIH